MDRRNFVRTAAGTAALGPLFWRAAYAAPAHPGPGPYGPLQEPDANGLMLPAGFTARVVAMHGQPVGPSDYPWHLFPDGGATYATDDGGWVYVSNSEVPGRPLGGCGAIRFGADGDIVDAYSILTGTSTNCAGGPTPWGTWLSCEEVDDGEVWECDPLGEQPAEVRPALGVFAHEAVAVDPFRGQLYLTEDRPDGRFYRFTPDAYPDLSQGRLEVAALGAGGAVTWLEVPDPSAAAAPTRTQVPASTVFDGGEGCWFDPATTGWVYFTTKGTDQVWVLDLAAQRIVPLYEAGEHDDPPLTGVDNVTVASSGDLYVAEDGGNLEIVVIAADTREVAPVMRIADVDHHEGSEITGPAFSPDGSRLYFSSQRGNELGVPAGPVTGSQGSGFGVTYEISGPFRTARVGIAALGASGRPETLPPAAPAPPARRAGTSSLPATGGGMAVAAGLMGLAAVVRRRTRPPE